MPVDRKSQPSPQRQTVLTFASPKVQDILFYETESPIAGKYGRYGRAIPEYGTAHPDYVAWPNHELVFAQLLDTAGTLRFYYAARRESQDDYNYELRDGQEVVRTYVIKRAEYGTAVFPIPAGGTLDTVFTAYGFAGDSIVSLDEPLASLYIAVQRRYIVAEVNEQIYDPSLETTVNVQKTLKPSGFQLTDPNPDLVNSAGTVYEIRHGNKYHDVLIKRYLSAADLVTKELTIIYGAQKYELPPRLDSANMVYRSAWVTKTTGSETSAQFSEDYFIDFNVTVASQGPFKTEIKRTRTSTPGTVVDSVLSTARFLPKVKQEDVSVAYAVWSTNPPAARAVARQYRVPPSLHGAVDITVNGTDSGSARTTLNRNRVIFTGAGAAISTDGTGPTGPVATIPANPVGFTGLTGTYLIDVDVQKIALDMFLVTVTSLIMPAGGVY
jgi:hypothetical protein